MATLKEVIHARDTHTPVGTDLITSGIIIGVTDTQDPAQALVEEPDGTKRWYPITRLTIPTKDPDATVTIPVPPAYQAFTQQQDEDTADRDSLLSLSPRRHLLMAARIIVGSNPENISQIMVREARAQTHLLFAIAKYHDMKDARDK